MTAFTTLAVILGVRDDWHVRMIDRQHIALQLLNNKKMVEGYAFTHWNTLLYEALLRGHMPSGLYMINL